MNETFSHSSIQRSRYIQVSDHGHSMPDAFCESPHPSVHASLQCQAGILAIYFILFYFIVKSMQYVSLRLTHLCRQKLGKALNTIIGS